MRSILALMRASWLTASSYRMGMIFSAVGLLLSVVPLYFISTALQSTMARVIETEGGQYFGFLIVGMVAYSFIPIAVQSLPNVIGGSANSGTLETVLGTPTSLPAMFTGLIGYNFLWATARALLLLGAATALGATILWSRVPAAMLVIGLIILSYVPIGMVGGAMILAFRSTGPLPQGVMALSMLLGGVYYPTRVVPSWLQDLSDFVPLTYGLRSLRLVLMDGTPLHDVESDLGMLVGMTMVLFVVGVLALTWALRYARRTGTLGQY